MEKKLNDEGFKKLDKNAEKAWFVNGAIETILTALVLAIIEVLVLFVFKINIPNWGIQLYNIIFVLITIILVLNWIVGTKIEYKQWKYKITEDKVEFSQGIFFVKTTVIPIIRVQHIEIEEGPLNKRFKLVNIKIFTAGGVHIIPNLGKSEALEISEYLKSKVKERVEFYEK